MSQAHAEKVAAAHAAAKEAGEVAEEDDDDDEATDSVDGVPIPASSAEDDSTSDYYLITT